MLNVPVRVLGQNLKKNQVLIKFTVDCIYWQGELKSNLKNKLILCEVLITRNVVSVKHTPL